MKNGKVLALEARIVLDTGIYCMLGMDILENTVVFSAGPYYIPNLKVNGKSWYTNNIRRVPCAGSGVNQVASALEPSMIGWQRTGYDPFANCLILDIGLPTASDHILTQALYPLK